MKLNTEIVPSSSNLKLSGSSISRVNSIGGLTIDDLYQMILELQDYVPSGGSSQYYSFTDGSVIYRIGARGTAYVRDRTLTATGFSGTEGIDWENIETITI